MAKKKINKLVVPLTLKTVSLLGAFTVMTTSIGGCAQKKKDSGNHSSTSTSTSSDTKDKLNNNSDTVISDQKDGSSIEEKDNQNSTTSKENTNQANNSTANNQSKPNKNTNNTQTNKTNDGNKQQPSNSGNVETPKQEMPTVLTAENINNVDVFKHFAAKLNKESFPGVTFFNYGYYYEGNMYYTNGEKEMEFMLAMINYKYLSSDTLTALFNSESLDNLKRYSSFIVTMVDMVRDKKITYNFSKYFVDKNLGNYIENNQKEYLNYILGDNNNFENLTKQYFNGFGSYHYNQGNNFYDNFLLLSTRLSGVNLRDYELMCQIDNIYPNISNSYNSLAGYIYNYSHGKIKKIN